MDFLKKKYDEELNSEGAVEIVGYPFDRSRILGELEPTTYDMAFADWLEQRRLRLLEKADEIISQFDNAPRFERLKRTYKAGGSIPFVGAGISIQCGYPGWTKFLYQTCAESHVRGDVLTELLQKGEYELAAQLLHDDLGAALFNENMESVFSSEKDLIGAIHYLPLLYPGSSVITTNYDRLIERAYKGFQQGFDTIKYGRSLAECVRLMAAGSRMLLKLHGECDQAEDRVLLKREYDAAYADGASVEIFFNRVLFGKSLLFVGCSLTVDRTIKSMIEVVSKYGATTLPRHYAILELKDDDDRVARKKSLAAANIFPIWYPENDHEESIESICLKLLED
ncbi:hypothetical protein DSOUD_1601 [Desulfuromonas soudanensis]|uniref:Uncharacterized protein n=1 Tax=Desulfuromonas soudanensis TaxID=1603606 RepID=A0A0M3QFK3_9BACT|nr:SIR2 family protein [Desulfuromonas soudanensis]ALC16379.1 hypothetical protein DSOUD_1601 [Desulfuromonas soudanensis]